MTSTTSSASSETVTMAMAGTWHRTARTNIRSPHPVRRPTLGAMSKPLVAILSGAGISTDSGIPDYRGPNGLWRRDPEAEKLVTYDTYMADPDVRRRAWLMRRDSEAWHARPNAPHLAVAELEKAGVAAPVITPDVDGLH